MFLKKLKVLNQLKALLTQNLKLKKKMTSKKNHQL